MPYFRAFSAFSVTVTNFMNSITFVMNYLFLISSDFSDFASLSDPQTLSFSSKGFHHGSTLGGEHSILLSYRDLYVSRETYIVFSYCILL